jgi:hypothetical protein
MKAIICTILLVMTILITHAQENAKIDEKLQEESDQTPNFPDSLKQHKVYFGTGFGYPWMFTANLTYLSRRNIGISVNYKGYILKSNNLPSDYVSNFWGMSSKPKDNFRAFSALFVIDIRTANQKVRPGFEAGISWVSYTEVNYLRQNPLAGAFIGIYQNYRTFGTTENFLGFQARAKLEILFNHIVGCELSLTGNINEYRSFVGIEAIFLIGWVRERTVLVD